MKTHRLLMYWISRCFAATVVLVLTASHTSAQNSDPVIVSQPQDISAVAGTLVQFVVSVSGTMPISNSWFRIANSTTTKFSGPVVGNDSSGTVSFTNTLYAQTTQTPQGYFAVCSNSAGVVTSRVATLTIQTVPAITGEPQDIQTNSGANVTLRVTATGASPLSYQWYYNGSTLAAATRSSLSLSNVSTSASGGYQAIVTNYSGSATSRVATLTIQAVPPTITGEPQDIQTNTGVSVTLKVTATGSTPLSYQWYYNGSALAAATRSSLSLSNVSTSASGGYQTIVTNSYGSATSRVATVTITAPPPQPPGITAQPTNVVVSTAGPSTAYFRVTATGDLPLAYQWCFDGSTLPSGTAASLSVSNAAGDTSHAGGYYVLITNGLGSVTSRVATLTFQALSPPRVTLLSHSATNGDVLLLSSLETNKNYTLLSSSDWQSWASLYSFLSRTTQLRYTNHQATNFSALYYRISSP